MKMISKDLNVIRRMGIESLAKDLGPVGMGYFLRQYDTGDGDYTKERKKYLNDVSLEKIKQELRAD